MMDGSKSLTFGRYLVAKRLEAGASLKSVSETTRIGVDLLGFIENEDHSRLPATVFVKGFIRAYAKAIGADGEKAVRLYLENLDVSQAVSVSEAELARFQETFWRRTLVSLGLLFCIITLTVYVEHLLYPHPPSEQSEIQVRDQSPPGDHVLDVGVEKTLGEKGPDAHHEKQTPVEQAVEIRTGMQAIEEKKQETTVATPAEVFSRPIDNDEDAGKQITATKEPSQNRRNVSPGRAGIAERYRLKIITIEKTWLKIVVDDHQPKEYSLKPGDELAFQAVSGYNLLIGNAAGVRLHINNTPIKVPADRGRVVRLQIP